MAIKILEYQKENNLIEAGRISFSKSNIISIVGVNGSGKTIFMNYIKDQFDNKSLVFKQIILKEDIEKVEIKLNKFFSTGKNQEKFINFIADMKENSRRNQKNVFKEFDNFIWDRFKNSYEQVIKVNFSINENISIWKKYYALKEKNYFNKELIKNHLPEIKDYVRFQKFQECKNNLDNIWKKLFSKPELITIDMNKDFILNDQIYRNMVGDPSLAECLRRNQTLFYLLLEVADIDNKKYVKIVNENIDIPPLAKQKIKNWFKSYVYQDLEINLKIKDSYYQISFYEKKTEIEFERLSSGTQNLLKIISQIKNLNSETIIQIDEPENGMHPLMQIQFRDFLEDLSRKTKTRFIIYTHSNYIVKDGINTLGLYIMVRKNNISKLYNKEEYVKAEKILDIQIFESIGYESINNYNFDKSKKIIIVEGNTDVLYLKKMAKFFKIDVNITKTKIGGATNIIKTQVLLEAVHNFKKDKIILSPDKDIEQKHPTIYRKINQNEVKYVPVGNEKRKEIEGFFAEKDKRYVVGVSGNKNKKMNKAILFWREENLEKKITDETKQNFKNYFKKAGLI